LEATYILVRGFADRSEHGPIEEVLIITDQDRPELGLVNVLELSLTSRCRLMKAGSDLKKQLKAYAMKVHFVVVRKYVEFLLP